MPILHLIEHLAQILSKAHRIGFRNHDTPNRYDHIDHDDLTSIAGQPSIPEPMPMPIPIRDWKDALNRFTDRTKGTGFDFFSSPPYRTQEGLPRLSYYQKSAPA
jgi:hypothetical protein